MPAVIANTSTRVLVTGANGFAAIWLVHTLLHKGYSVRGTVRSESKASFLKDRFKEFGDQLEVVVVEDISRKGAFDDVVKDVDAIEHTASPFHFNAKDAQELLVPAIQGTVGVLESAVKYGSRVKRIVILSSCAAVAAPGPPEPTLYSEKDWNTQAIEKSKTTKDGGVIYQASKILSEQAAWEFYEKNRASVAWDLTVINSPWIFGPTIHDMSSPSELNTSSANWYNYIVKGSKTSQAELEEGECWIDPRDLAQALVLAIEKEQAGGERIIVGAGAFIWQDWLNVVNGIKPPPTKHVAPKGSPELSDGFKYPVTYDTSKAAQILGIQYRTKEQTAIDSLKDFEARGW